MILDAHNKDRKVTVFDKYCAFHFGAHNFLAENAYFTYHCAFPLKYLCNDLCHRYTKKHVIWCSQ